VVDRPSNSSRKQRTAQLLIDNTVTLLFATGFQGNAATWFKTYNTNFSPIAKAFPPNLHLQTLRAVSDSNDDVLLRLNHIYAVGEDAEYSKPAQIDLYSIFKDFLITQVTEMNLSANIPLSQMKRYQWKTDSDAEDEEEVEERSAVVDAASIELKPQEIRTFIVRMEGRK